MTVHKEEVQERSRGKAPGRSLGDFLKQDGLLPAEEALLKACQDGTKCLLGKARPEPPFDPKTLEIIKVRAGFLRFLALGGDESVIMTEWGIHLEGAYIDAGLNLSETAGIVRLYLNKCYIDGDILLFRASLSSLSLDGSRVDGINANWAKTTGSVSLANGFLSESEVSFHSASLGGQFDCTGGSFTNLSGRALNCESAKIASTVFLNDGFKSEGEVAFHSACLGGALNCTGGSFTNLSGRALNCESAKITGTVFLNDGFKSEGEVTFHSACLGGALNCTRGSFTNLSGRALNCESAKITGTVFLKDGFQSKGEVAFPFASLGGPIDCTGGSFTGEVSFFSAAIEGDLICSGGRFENAHGTALNLEYTRVARVVFLNQIIETDKPPGARFDATGTVSLYGAQIGGNLECTGGSFKAPRFTATAEQPDAPAARDEKSAIAIQGTLLTVAGAVFFDSAEKTKVEQDFEGFTSEGEIRLVAAKIATQIICAGGVFVNKAPQTDDKTLAGYALNLGLSAIGDGLLLGDENLDSTPAAVLGSVALTGTKMFRLYDQGFVGEAGPRPEYFPAEIQGVNGEKLKCCLWLDDLSYDRLDGSSVLTAKARKAWLKRQPPKHLSENFRHEPFDQLAKVLVAMGRAKEAREINIFRQQLLTKRFDWSRKLAGGVTILFFAGLALHFFVPFAGNIIWALLFLSMLWSGGANWLFRQGYNVFSRYGYQPGLTIFWVLLVGLLSGLFYEQAAMQGVFVPKDEKVLARAKDCGPDWTACRDPRFNAYVFAFDAMLPIGRLGEADRWRAQPKAFDLDVLGRKLSIPEMGTQYLLWSEAVFGWLVGGIVLAVIGRLWNKN